MRGVVYKGYVGEEEGGPHKNRCQITTGTSSVENRQARTQGCSPTTHVGTLDEVTDVFSDESSPRAGGREKLKDELNESVGVSVYGWSRTPFTLQ